MRSYLPDSGRFAFNPSHRVALDGGILERWISRLMLIEAVSVMKNTGLRNSNVVGLKRDLLLINYAEIIAPN